MIVCVYFDFYSSQSQICLEELQLLCSTWQPSYRASVRHRKPTDKVQPHRPESHHVFSTHCEDLHRGPTTHGRRERQNKQRSEWDGKGRGWNCWKMKIQVQKHLEGGTESLARETDPRTADGKGERGGRSEVGESPGQLMWCGTSLNEQMSDRSGW